MGKLLKHFLKSISLIYCICTGRENAFHLLQCYYSESRHFHSLGEEKVVVTASFDCKTVAALDIVPCHILF